MAPMVGCQGEPTHQGAVDVIEGGGARPNGLHHLGSLFQSRRQASRWIGDGVSVISSCTVTLEGSLGFLTEESLHIIVELISWVRPQALKEHPAHGLDDLWIAGRKNWLGHTR